MCLEFYLNHLFEALMYPPGVSDLGIKSRELWTQTHSSCLKKGWVWCAVRKDVAQILLFLGRILPEISAEEKKKDWCSDIYIYYSVLYAEGIVQLTKFPLIRLFALKITLVVVGFLNWPPIRIKSKEDGCWSVRRCDKFQWGRYHRPVPGWPRPPWLLFRYFLAQYHRSLQFCPACPGAGVGGVQVQSCIPRRL